MRTLPCATGRHASTSCRSILLWLALHPLQFSQRGAVSESELRQSGRCWSNHVISASGLLSIADSSAPLHQSSVTVARSCVTRHWRRWVNSCAGLVHRRTLNSTSTAASDGFRVGDKSWWQIVGGRLWSADRGRHTVGGISWAAVAGTIVVQSKPALLPHARTSKSTRSLCAMVQKAPTEITPTHSPWMASTRLGAS